MIQGGFWTEDHGREVDTVFKEGFDIVASRFLQWGILKDTVIHSLK